MNKKNKIPFFLVLLIVIIGLLVTCYVYGKQFEKHSSELSIGFYTDSSWDVPKGNQYHMIDYAIRQFHRQHPEIKLHYENGIRKQDYQSWLSNQIVKGKAPDVIIVPQEDFNLLASIGAFKNLDNYITASNFNSHQFYSGPWQAGRYNGKQYALPYETNPTLMVANQNLLRKNHVHASFASEPQPFERACRRISRYNAYGLNANYTWQEALLAYNADAFSGPNHSINLTSTQARKGFSFLTSLYNYQTRATDTQLFDQAKVAFMPITLAQYRTYTSYPFHVTKNNNFRWQIMRMPGIKNAKATPASTVCFAVSSHSGNPIMAWQFIKMMCSNPKIQQELMKVHKGSSVLRRVVNSPKTAKELKAENFGNELISTKQLNRILDNEAVLPKFKRYNDIYGQLDYQINQALTNQDLDTQLFNIQMNLNKNKN